MNIVGAHLSICAGSGRHPIYEDQGLTLSIRITTAELKNINGLPIHSLERVVFKRTAHGRLNISEDGWDPVVGISDLLVHLSGDQMQKTGSEGRRGRRPERFGQRRFQPRGTRKKKNR